MAEAVVEGAQSVQGVEAELTYYTSPEVLSNYDAIIVGVPTYHHDMTMDIKHLFEEASEKGINLQGKTAAAFGSYGWSGEAPKLVIEIMKNKFAMNVTEPPLLARYSPDQATLEKCRDLGKRVAENLIHAT